MLQLLLVEDQARLRAALKTGLEATGAVQVIADCASGEEALERCLAAPPEAILMDLQRRRMAESQVLDRRTRRTLHDEILPRLHTAILRLSSSTQGAMGSSAEVVDLLAGVHRQVADLLRETPAHTRPELSRLGLAGALRQAVEKELGHAFDSITWQVEPQAEARTRELSPVAAEVLFHAAREAVRNAALHGRGSDAARPLHLQVAVTWRGGLEIAIVDDGVGLGTGAEVQPGIGQGLDLHSTMMAVIGGSLAAVFGLRLVVRREPVVARRRVRESKSPRDTHRGSLGAEEGI